MPIIHKVTGNVGGAEKTVYVVYTPVSGGSCEFSDGFDLIQAVHDAALQYALSQQADGEDAAQMSYMDFVLNVPLEFCEANGFRKLNVESSAKPFRGNQICFTVHDVRWHRNKAKMEQQKETAFSEVFGEFGRRLGALHHEMPALSGWSLPQIAQQMLLWSQEFIGRAGWLDGCFAYPDVEAYVNEKLTALGNGRRLEPPEVKPPKKRGRRAKA